MKDTNSQIDMENKQNLSISKKVCHLACKHKMNDMRIFEKECKALATGGFEVTLIGFGEKEQTKMIDGVCCISLFCPIKNDIDVLTKRNKLIYKAAIQVDADLYHLHEPELLPVAKKLKRDGKVVVFDSHEFYGWQLHDNIHKIKIIRVPAFLMRVFGNLYMQYEKRICKTIDAVIQVCTMNGVDYFANRCKQSIFIRNLPNTNDYHRKSSIDFTKDISVAMIGGITKERGVTQLVLASHRVGTRLLLAGDFTPKSYKKELEEMQEYNCVEYKGFLNKDGMLALMEQVQIGASTLLNVGQYDKIDTLPTKVYDYMSMELPVILSNTPFALKMNEKYHFAICVNPSDPVEIADAITWLKSHPKEAIEMGKNGRRAIEEELNWQKECEKLIDFYNQLLKQAP